MKRTALISFVGLVLLVGCSKDELGNQNRQEITELQKTVTTIQEQVKKLSASLVKVQQSQEEIRQLAASPNARQEEINTRLTGVEKQLAESSIQLDAINKTVTNLRMEKLKAPDPFAAVPAPAPVAAVPQKPARTKEFLLAAVDRGLKNAAISAILSTEDSIRLEATARYFIKEINSGNDPRLTVDDLLRSTPENKRLFKWFPEFLPE